MTRLANALDLDGTASVTALLGPTNTGKTHRAIQRMLAHRTGMIGLPLRLLAREVYDRVVREKGADVVALVTGEEKRVPPTARYFVCTVESMPVDRPVAFLAVDEIQLAAHRTRGHAFTDRLLHARGLRETMFLGAATIAPLLQQLVPTARIESYQRLSKLSFAGSRKLTALPPRSAVVAFSAARVYALAERLRSHRGGVAVVLGALSPRTRNAQVEMYQSGEVQHLVATDAIGMGLNMDIHHVALADVAKFDGRSFRELDPAEVAQIAGRAGRFRRDGTFGTTAGLDSLDPALIDAVEQHQFAPLRRVYWRSAELDLSSPDGLLASLDVPSGRRELIAMRDADDHETLRTLLGRAEVKALLDGPGAVALLWEVCGVPDYRKTLTGSHADLLAQLYVHLRTRGRLPDDWVAARVKRLDREDGDIETLMARIAFIRTWTYISFRGDWLGDARHWQERTQAIEDRLSDALHAGLTARFVDRRAVALTAHLASSAPVEASLEGSSVRVAGQVLGELRGLDFVVASSASRAADRAVRRAVAHALRPLLTERMAAVMAAPDDEFSFDARARVTWRGEPVARLVRRPDPWVPGVAVLATAMLSADERRDVERRVTRWVRTTLDDLAAPLRAASGAVGAVAYAVLQGLGTASRREVVAALGRLDDAGRRQLAALGIRLGARAVYAASWLSPATLQLRAVLWAVQQGQETVPTPPVGLVSPPDPSWPEGFLRAVGFGRVAGVAVRVDVLERVAAWLHRAERSGRAPELRDAARMLATDERTAARVIRDLSGGRR